MGLFRPSRERRSGRFLEARVVLFLAGALFGMAGMALQNGLLVYLGIGFLAVGVLLRALPERGERGGGEGEAGER